MYRGKNFFIYSITIFCFLFLVFGSCKATKLYLEPSQGELTQGDTFLVEIAIDTEGECINTIGVNLDFSPDILKAVDFSQGNSIIVLWIESPIINQESGSISFSGMIPGGYCGMVPGNPGLSNLIGRIIFQVKEGIELEPVEKNTKVNFSEATKVLLNDGSGTLASLNTLGGDFKISSGRTETTKDEWEKEIENDATPPESFKIEIQKDPTIFEGKYFITFFTTDKQTGVDHYEILEESGILIKRVGKWVRAESPYLLKDQNLKSNIFVKVIDKAGNERVETLPAPKPFIWYKNYLILVIITLGVIIAYLIWKILWKKHSHLK